MLEENEYLKPEAPKEPAGDLSKPFYLLVGPLGVLLLLFFWNRANNNPDAKQDEVNFYLILLAGYVLLFTGSFLWDYLHKGQRFKWGKKSS